MYPVSHHTGTVQVHDNNTYALRGHKRPKGRCLPHRPPHLSSSCAPRPQATSNHYGTRITLITSYAQEFIIQIEPSRSRTNRTLYLSFWAEVHYNSIYPASDPPRHAKDTPPPPPPKLLGSRKLGQLARNIGIQEHHD